MTDPKIRSLSPAICLALVLVAKQQLMADPIPDDWKSGSASLQPKEVRSRKKAIRWIIPGQGCSLVYSFRTRVWQDLRQFYPTRAKSMGIDGTYHAGEVTARPARGAPDRLTFSLTGLRAGRIKRSNRLPATVRDVRKSPELVFVARGSELTQVGSPQGLEGMVTALQFFFPRLPLKKTARWTVKVTPALSSTKKRSAASTTRVRLVRWLKIRRQTAVELRASWSSTDRMKFPGPSGAPRFFESHLEGRYIVLDSGRLLHASLAGELKMVMGKKKRNVLSHHRFYTHLRLVSACDGAVMAPPFKGGSTVKERALASYGQLTRGLVTRDKKAIRGALSPTVLTAHGAGKVVELLIRHAQRFGSHALGRPDDARDVKVKGRRASLLLTSAVEDYHQDLLETRVSVDGSDRITRIATSRSMLHPDGAGPMLEVSTKKLFSPAATWRPVTIPRTVLTTENAVSAPKTGFLLIRRNRSYCALKLLSTGRRAARYTWYYQKDGGRSGLHRGSRGWGRVWEVSRPLGDGTYSTKGSKLDLTCGPFRLKWSVPAYVYFGSAVRDLDFTITGVDSIEKVRVNDPGLVWLSKRWGTLPYDPTADLLARRRIFRR